MTKRFFVLLMLLVSVSLMTAGIVSAQNYWNNPWNNNLADRKSVV